MYSRVPSERERAQTIGTSPGRNEREQPRRILDLLLLDLHSVIISLSHTTMSTEPTLQPGGRQKLDEFLRQSVDRKHTPALFFGATNVNEIFYYNQAGLIKFDDPNSGQITEDTGEY
jgi:hypothetical protein